MQNKIPIFVVLMLLCRIPGIYAAQLLFTPAFTVNQEYTDNLFLDEENNEEEWITIAGIDLAGQILWPSGGVDVSYRPAYLYYVQNNNLNYWRHQASVKFWKDLTQNTKLEVKDSYLQTNEPIQIRQGLDQGPISTVIDDEPGESAIVPLNDFDRNRRGRQEYYTNTAQAVLIHQFGSENNVFAAYSLSTTEDLDTSAGTVNNNYRISTPSIGLNFNFTTWWSLQSVASYASSDYENRQDRDEFNGRLRLLRHFTKTLSGFIAYRHTVLKYTQDIQEDYQIYEPSVGIEYSFRDNARAAIAVGYYIQEFESSDSMEGFNITANINKQWVYRNVSFGLLGSSGYVIDDNGVEDNGLNIYYQIRANTAYSFTPRFRGVAYAAYRYDDYPNEPITRNEHSTTAGLGLNYQSSRWVVIGCTYDFSTFDSGLGINEYTENKIQLTIRIAPPTAYRWN